MAWITAQQPRPLQTNPNHRPRLNQIPIETAERPKPDIPRFPALALLRREPQGQHHRMRHRASQKPAHNRSWTPWPPPTTVKAVRVSAHPNYT